MNQMSQINCKDIKLIYKSRNQTHTIFSPKQTEWENNNRPS